MTGAAARHRHVQIAKARPLGGREACYAVFRALEEASRLRVRGLEGRPELVPGDGERSAGRKLARLLGPLAQARLTALPDRLYRSQGDGLGLGVETFAARFGYIPEPDAPQCMLFHERSSPEVL